MSIPVRDGTIHQSRTERHTMKVRRLSDGVVIERQPPDAHAMIDRGGFEFVGLDVPSAFEVLDGMNITELVARASQHFHVAPGTARTYLIAELVKLVEAGTIILNS
jgi:hypothetical protein